MEINYNNLDITEEEKLEIGKLKKQKEEEIEFALIKFQLLKGKNIEGTDCREIEVFLEELGINNIDYFNILLVELGIENRNDFFKSKIEKKLDKSEDVSNLKVDVAENSNNAEKLESKFKFPLIEFGILMVIVTSVFGFLYFKNNSSIDFMSYFQNSSSFSKKEQEYFENNFSKILNKTSDIKGELENKNINSNIMEIYYKINEGDLKGIEGYVEAVKKDRIYNFKIYMSLMCIEIYTNKFENLFVDYKSSKEKIAFNEEEVKMLNRYGENLLKTYEKELNNSYSFFNPSIYATQISDNLYVIEHTSKITQDNLKNSIIYSTTIEKNKNGFVALNKNGIIAKDNSLEDLLKNPAIFVVTEEMINEAKKNNDELNKSISESFQGVNDFIINEESTNNSNKNIGWDVENLNSELRDFESPVTQFETDSYTIRIDKKYDGYYRMAIWKKGTSTIESPPWLFTNGVMQKNSEGNKFIGFSNSLNEKFYCFFDKVETPSSFQYYDAKENDSGESEPTIFQDVLGYTYSYLN